MVKVVAGEHDTQPATSVSRRGALAGAAAVSLVFCQPSTAGESALQLAMYTDEADKFDIGIPEGWASASGQISGGDGPVGSPATRRALAWFPGNNAKDVNVTLVITNTAADFTKLGSFGKATDFGTNLVNSMDQSYLLRGPKWARKNINEEDIQVVRLIDAKDFNEGYLIEYEVENARVDKKYLLSLVTLGFNGRYNRLYTITAQCPAKDLPEYEATFRAVCKSFKPPAMV